MRRVDEGAVSNDDREDEVTLRGPRKLCFRKNFSVACGINILQHIHQLLEALR